MPRSRVSWRAVRTRPLRHAAATGRGHGTRSGAGRGPHAARPHGRSVRQKVDLRRAGDPGAPANDHDGPPASGVARAHPPVEQEPHGEVQLDTGTGGPTREAPRNASRRDRGPSRQGGRFPDENPARERRADERRKDQRRQERQPTPDPVGEPLRETFPTVAEALPGIPGPHQEGGPGPDRAGGPPAPGLHGDDLRGRRHRPAVDAVLQPEEEPLRRPAPVGR